MTQRSLKKLFVCRLHLNAILRKCQWKRPRGHYSTTWFTLQKNKCHFTYKLEFRRTDWYEQLSDLIYVLYTVNIQRQKVKQYLCFAFSKQVDYEASRLCRRFSSCSLFYFLLFFVSVKNKSWSNLHQLPDPGFLISAVIFIFDLCSAVSRRIINSSWVAYFCTFLINRIYAYDTMS